MERINCGRVKSSGKVTKKPMPQQQWFVIPMNTVSVKQFYVPTQNGISMTKCLVKDCLTKQEVLNMVEGLAPMIVRPRIIKYQRQ